MVYTYVPALPGNEFQQLIGRVYSLVFRQSIEKRVTTLLRHGYCHVTQFADCVVDLDLCPSGHLLGSQTRNVCRR
jgi:hypothetical protein